MDIVSYVLAKKSGVVGGKVTLGTQDKISLGIRGHHLLSTVIGDSASFMIPGQTVDDTGSTSMVECRQEAKETRIITHGNSADAWITAKSVAIGDRIRPTDAKATGFIYIATVGGTTGATEPATWPSAEGETVVDNNITWTRNVVLDKSGALKDGAYPEFVDKFDQEWVSSTEEPKYTYNVIPQQSYVLQRLYFKLGPNLIWDDATCRVRIHIYRGTSEAGTKIYDQSLGPAEATATGQVIAANSEVWIDIDNISYTEGEELHFVAELISTDPACKLAVVTNAGNAQPWRAVDRQTFQHIELIPADTIFAPVEFTEPVAGATGVSLTPTVTTLQGAARRTGYHGAPNTSASNGVSATALQFTLPANAMGSGGTLKGSFFLTQVGSTTTPWFFFEVGDAGIQGVLGCPTESGRFHVDVEFIALSISEQLTIISRSGATITDMRTHNADLSDPIVFTLYLSGGLGGTTTLDAYDIQVFNNNVSYMSYVHSGTEVKIKDLAKNEFVSSGSGSGLSATPTTALTGATRYKPYARHKTSSGIYLPWTAGPTFTTLFELTVNVDTTNEVGGLTSSLVSGDLIRVSVGETVNSIGYNFHVSGQSVEFPPTAYDSGEFRFKDSVGTDLLFRINSITGVAPNRTAVCDIETNTQVLSNGIIKLVGAGTPAANASQFESAWSDQLWTPTSLTRAIDVDFTSVASLGALSTIANTGTLGGNFVQATGTKQPTIVDTDATGYRSANFDGTDDELRSSVNLPLGTRYTLIAAFRQNASSVQTPVFTDEYNPDSNINYAMGHSTSINEYTGTANTFGGGHFNGGWRKTTGLAYTIGSFGFAAVRYDGANMRLRMNGGTEQLTAQVSNPNTSTTVAHIGSNYYTTPTAYTNMRMFRLLAFSSSISDADVEKVEGWLAFKYGQLALLPAGHAYKTTPFRTLYTDKFISVS